MASTIEHLEQLELAEVYVQVNLSTLSIVSLIDPLGSVDFTYMQVANSIAARIEIGEFTHKLPAERALAEEYGVAYQTLRHAMQVLRDRGLIITRQGRGTFVSPPARPAGSP
jgi:regulatory GntR family protein